MRKFLLPILSIIFVIGIATFVWASVMGTPHELAAEPCAMCHTPHHATSQYPLWNRYQVLEEGAYTMYTSPTFNMGEGLSVSRDPNPPSSLCLTCHNGIASILVNYPGPCSETDTSYDLEISGCADLDTYLQDDHPISFQYTNEGIDDDNALNNNGFPYAEHPAGTTMWAIQGTSLVYYPLFTSGQGDHGFECATCHSVHHVEPDYDPVATHQVYFLRHDNTESELCRDCHVKK